MTRAREVEDVLRRERVVACVRADDAGLARAAAFAALRGGARVLEITLTTPGALETIEALA
ncbi:2-dehydro-3-deoxyphosphogluconate aldolase, partial [bacterium]|nr:2-dehydro-3-deoxyphosphogluconate aldolase [bacterium]